MEGTYVLRVECADAKGLIHKITGVLYRHGLNIIQNGEFVDTEKKRFSGRSRVPRLLRMYNLMIDEQK